jgi:hypothetical protein
MLAKVLLLLFLIAFLGVYLLVADHYHYGLIVLLLLGGLIEDPGGRFVLGFVAAGIVVVCASLAWAYSYWQNRNRQAVIIELLNYIIHNMK